MPNACESTFPKQRSQTDRHSNITGIMKIRPEPFADRRSRMEPSSRRAPLRSPSGPVSTGRRKRLAGSRGSAEGFPASARTGNGLASLARETVRLGALRVSSSCWPPTDADGTCCCKAPRYNISLIGRSPHKARLSRVLAPSSAQQGAEWAPTRPTPEAPSGRSPCTPGRRHRFRSLRCTRTASEFLLLLLLTTTYYLLLRTTYYYCCYYCYY